MTEKEQRESSTVDSSRINDFIDIKHSFVAADLYSHASNACTREGKLLSKSQRCSRVNRLQSLFGLVISLAMAWQGLSQARHSSTKFARPPFRPVIPPFHGIYRLITVHQIGVYARDSNSIDVDDKTHEFSLYTGKDK